jgi:undecaprenyl-diphosphatase
MTVRLATIDPSSAIRSLSGHSGALDSAMEWIASDGLYVVAVILLLLWLRPRGFRACVAAGSAAVLAVGVSGVIGAVWDRPRPFVAGHFTPLISHAADASFPSDHVAALAAVAAAVWFVSRGLGALAWLLAGLVGLARVYVGVHYLGDIAGGAVLGLIAGLSTWLLTEKILRQLDVLDRLAVHLHLRPPVDRPGSHPEDSAG